MYTIEAAKERWQVFSGNFLPADQEKMQDGFPRLEITDTMEQTVINKIMEGLLTTSIPVTEVKFKYTITAADYKNLNMLMESLERSHIVTSLILKCKIFDLKFQLIKPFFDKLASAQCRLPKLYINWARMTDDIGALFDSALSNNKSIQTLILKRDYPALKSLHKNTTIKALSIISSTFGRGLVEALQRSQTLTDVALSHDDDATLDINRFEAICKALGSMTTLKTFDIELGVAEWSMKPLVNVFSGDAKLTQLRIGSKREFIGKCRDVDVFGAALSAHPSLTVLDLSYPALPVLEHIQSSLSCKHLIVPVSAPIMYNSFGKVVASIRSLERVTFANSSKGDCFFINFLDLIRKESRVQVWEFCNTIEVKPEVLENLKNTALRPCQIIFRNKNQERIEEFSKMMLENPFLDVQFPEWYAEIDELLEGLVDKKVPITSSRQAKLLLFKTTFQFLSTILLTRSDNLFSLLPREILLPILQNVVEDKISSNKLLRAIELARDRDFMLGPNTTDAVPTIVKFWIG